MNDPTVVIAGPKNTAISMVPMRGRALNINPMITAHESKAILVMKKGIFLKASQIILPSPS